MTSNLYRANSAPRIQEYNTDGGESSAEGTTSSKPRFEAIDPSQPEKKQMAANSAQKDVSFSMGVVHKPNDTRPPVNSNDNDSTNKSWENIETLEKLPKMDHYRKTLDDASGISKRPSMLELMHGTLKNATVLEVEDYKKNDENPEGQGTMKSNAGAPAAAHVKFGWIQGVFVRCFLNILGVMLYLRISWVAGQAGLFFGTLIVLLACTVTTLTAISMCAICTNGYVRGGGTYFLISRSLGPEFGGSIGIIFSIANAVAAAMYVVGFSETVRDLMKEHGLAIFDNGLNDIRVIGLVTCSILMGIVFIGTSFESKMQMGLLVILTVSIVNFLVGTFLPVTEAQASRGITGYSWVVLTENMLPIWRGEGFFSVFGVFFPAATGIMAGANISGDLKDPSSAIPQGTLLSILVTTIIYLGTVWLTGTTTVRDATGYGYPLTYSNGSYEYIEPTCVANQTCEYGLMNYFQVVEALSAWGPLITAGIFAATLSSALASLVSAPKIFQAVCRDQLFPYVHFFAKGYGNDDEPRRAYGLAYIIAMVMILIGDLNLIAPVISNFFLAAYALINYSCFDASMSLSPGFRPTFRYYNKWVSLMGALLCVSVMFIISWWTALLTYIFFVLLFMYIKRRKPDANWGSSTQANTYKNAYSGILRLTKTEEHVKNYRPQLLILTGNPVTRTPLVDFAYNITKGNSLIVCGHVIPYEPSENVFSYVKKLDSQLNTWLSMRKIKAFYSPVANTSLRYGTQTLLQTAGLGKLRPNILLIGFKSDWNENGPRGLHEISEYVGVIRDAFDSGMGVGVLRNGEHGLDYSLLMKYHKLDDIYKLKDFEPDPSTDKLDKLSVEPSIQRRLTSPGPVSPMKNVLNTGDKGASENLGFDIGETEINLDEPFEEDEKHMKTPIAQAISMQKAKMTSQRDVASSINRFRRRVKKAVIDVWWLYDDGGLTLLLPHLLTQHKSYLEGAKLRVFTIATSHSAMEQEQRSMVALLSKFRVEFADVFVLPDVTKKPSSATISEFEQLIHPFRANSNDSSKGLITDEELIAQANRTNRQMRIRELLLQHSTEAQLVVLTLPVPRKEIISSSLYMAWLELLTRGMPPTLLIRGNQTSVLTFYS